MSRFLLFFLLFGLLTCYSSHSQKLKFKQKIKIYYGEKADDSAQVFVLKTSTSESIAYHIDSTKFIYQPKKTIDWKKSDVLDSAMAISNNISINPLDASVVPKEGYIQIYFWNLIPDSKILKSKNDAAIDKEIKETDEANKFLNSNTFGIRIPRWTNLKLHYSRFHAGAMILPFKVFLGSRDGDNSNNVVTAANAGVYLGALFGTKRYFNDPSKDKLTEYEYGWSINGILGLNKLDLNNKNSIVENSFEGSVLSTSVGASIGWHYKVFTIFAASGFDLPLSNNAENWKFKGKPWLGFGLGFEIF